MKCLDSTFQLVHVPSRNCWRNDLTVQVTRNSSPVSAYMAIGPWLSVLDSFFVCMGLPFGFGLWNSNCLPAGNPTHSRVFRGAALFCNEALGPLRARALGGLFLCGVRNG